MPETLILERLENIEKNEAPENAQRQHQGSQLAEEVRQYLLIEMDKAAKAQNSQELARLADAYRMFIS